MYIMFTYDDNYVGKQTSSNRVGCCTHLHFILHKKNTGSKKTSVVPMCVLFLSMLMRVKRQTSNKAGGMSQNGMKNKRLLLKLAFKTCLFVRAKQ